MVVCPPDDDELIPVPTGPPDDDELVPVPAGPPDDDELVPVPAGNPFEGAVASPSTPVVRHVTHRVCGGAVLEHAHSRIGSAEKRKTIISTPTLARACAKCPETIRVPGPIGT